MIVESGASDPGPRARPIVPEQFMTDRKRILVADDDEDLLDILQMDLARQGYDTVVATNGKDALHLAMTERLDLILLDVMMPYLDGYHVANEVSSRLGRRAPQIIMMTCRNVTKENGISLLSGARESIQKPFEISKLHTCLAAALDARAGEGAMDA
jgi:DNA-binding response OmpR family regulator